MATKAAEEAEKREKAEMRSKAVATGGSEMTEAEEASKEAMSETAIQNDGMTGGAPRIGRALEVVGKAEKAGKVVHTKKGVTRLLEAQMISINRDSKETAIPSRRQNRKSCDFSSFGD